MCCTCQLINSSARGHKVQYHATHRISNNNCLQNDLKATLTPLATCIEGIVALQFGQHQEGSVNLMPSWGHEANFMDICIYMFVISPGGQVD